MYCTVADVRFRAQTITIDVIDDATVQDLIEQAQAEVDAHLCQRYTVPFDDPAPTLVRSITAALAASLALVNQHSGDGTSDEVPLHTRLRAMARGQLGDLVDGKTRLPGIVRDPGARLSARTGCRPPLARFDGCVPPSDDDCSS
jgi:phage gp36-like protein